MTIVYNRSAICEKANQLLREHHARRSANGGVWFGKPVTISECMRRAWTAARQEANGALRGYNLSTLQYVSIK